MQISQTGNLLNTPHKQEGYQFCLKCSLSLSKKNKSTLHQKSEVKQNRQREYCRGTNDRTLLPIKKVLYKNLIKILKEISALQDGHKKLLRSEKPADRVQTALSRRTIEIRPKFMNQNSRVLAPALRQYFLTTLQSFQVCCDLVEPVKMFPSIHAVIQPHDRYWHE